ncbi:MAG TPA: Mur ligase family protein [Candidatus Saccharimonadales bacterium]
MKQLQTLAAARTALLAFSPLDMKGKYQLGRMRKLMEFLGNPQDTLNVIHVAGTSGKTSTAYFLCSMLELAGQRTGLTISPHITGINERVQLNGQPLSEARFLFYVNQFLPLVGQSGLQPTYFELLVALAYWVFAEEKVDYAVIETGLGGLLDGTNVVTRADKLCVITEIGLDHTEILGETIAEIAAQKAGIIQPHNQVLMLEQPKEIIAVIQQAAKKRQASVTIVREPDAPKKLTEFQKRNWSLAKAALHYLQQRDSFALPAEVQLERAAIHTPPGRWEIYHYRDKALIIDGAHNPQELEALVSALQQQGIASAAVLANFKQAPRAKIAASLRILQPITSHLIIPEFTAGQDLKRLRSCAATELADLAARQKIKSTEVQPDAADALNTLLNRPEKTLLITGSLYLISSLRHRIPSKVRRGV